jgi:hypothetical protein
MSTNCKEKGRIIYIKRKILCGPAFQTAPEYAFWDARNLAAARHSGEVLTGARQEGGENCDRTTFSLSFDI